MGRIFRSTVFFCVLITSVLCLDPPRFLDYSEIDGRFLNESIPEQFVIGTVYAEDPDGTPVTFYLSGEGLEFFQIDRNTGVVTLKKLIDYEQRDDKEISMIFTIIDGDGERESVPAKVFLDDVNDEVPVFVSGAQFKEISEDNEPGLEVAIISVTDPDVTVEFEDDRLSVVCVRETPNQRDACEKFGLEFTNIDVSNKFWRGRVVLREKLDYEQRISYVIKLLASDGRQNATQEVHVEVVDINDTPPRWVISNDRTINEELPVGTIINTVSAVDQDTESPHPIAYDLIGDNADIFSINETTGDISPTIQIDFDDDNVQGLLIYELTVRASEVISQVPLQLGNDSSNTATTVVTITVEDIDDNAPTFNRDPYVVSIKEDIETRANIPGLQMTVTDKDSGIFNSFDLLVLTHEDVFGIIPSRDAKSSSATLFIKNSDLIDFEDDQKKYFEVLVVARENRVIPALSGNTTVRITVEDVNDEVPDFTRDIYQIVIKEDRDVNSHVIQTLAEDRELGDFGTSGIRYTLYGNQLGHFKIDPLTGDIRTGPCSNGPTHGQDPCINYERRKSYSLTVSATDELGKGQTRPFPVTIIIEDVNDNRPRIEPAYTAYIYEGNMVTESPLIIDAQDPDIEGGPLIYSLAGESGPFQITVQGPTSARVGNITARRAVLYSDAQDPNTGEVKFKVNVADGLDSSTADVTIIIIDINNNDPVFFPPEYEEWIPENTTGRVYITTISASDADAPTLGNGQLEFDISTGAQGKFTVNDSAAYRDGVWYADVYTLVDATFNYEAQNLYEMTLVARDLGTPASKSGFGKLTVHITDINNNAPQIDPPSFSLLVSENERVSTIVHTVRATDPDDDSELRYYFTPTRAQTPVGQVVDPNDFNYTKLFALNEKTGDVSVSSQLNRDLTSFISYDLFVVDINGAVPQTGTGALFINILEYNDQSPQFELNPYEIVMNEELYPNFLVRNLRCSDADDKIAGYSIRQIDPPFPNFFALIDNTGSMIVRSRVDYEAVQFIELEGTCEDSGNPRRSNTTRIFVTVVNLNDNSPVFDAPLYQATLPEQTQSGASVVTVAASDIDLEDFGVVRFRMADPSVPFTIDPISGYIEVGNDTIFDREVSSSFSFQVVAYDSPNNSAVRRETQVPVYISVQDINDNCPIFRSDYYEGSIPESAPSGTFIIDIVADDRDSGINGSISFSVTIGSGSDFAEDLFTVSRSSGRVVTRDILRRRAGTYFFNVTAIDMNGQYPSPPACISQVPVRIDVTQSENNPPIWIRPPQRDFVIEVLESQYEGMLVYSSRATDVDQGLPGIVDYSFVVGDQFVSATPEFRINEITGVIRAEIEFDREQVDTYFLTLMARDKGVPAASSRTTLTIVILDLDDNEPRFPMRDGVVLPLVISLDEDVSLEEGGNYLASCNATDLDSDHRNNRIFYELFAPDDTISELIHLGRDNCNIRLKKNPDFEVTPTLRFNILAFNERSDDSVRRYRREVNPSILPVIINVGNANDNPPTFSRPRYMACAYDDAPFLQNILFIEVTDSDGGTAPELTLEGTNSFRIDSTGNIQNIQSLNSLRNTVQTFQVKANDEESNTATADVTIFVVGTSNQVRIKQSRPRLDAFTDQAAALITAETQGIDFTCAQAEDFITSEGEASDFSSELVVAAVRIDSSSQPPSYHIYSAAELRGILEANGEYIEVEEEDDDDFELSEDAVIIVFVICLVLVIIALLLFCLACYCIRDRKKKKTKKIKSQRHTVVQASEEQASSFQNPVYYNHGYKPEEPEYAKVKKVKPIAPVVIAAPQNLEPLDSDPPSDLVPEPQPQPALGPEPVIVTEVLPAEKPESPQIAPEPEFEDRIETIIVDELPVPVSQPPVEENVIEVEFGEEPPELPPPSDDFIDVEIVDEIPLPSPPPAENEFRIETSVEDS